MIFLRKSKENQPRSPKTLKAVKDYKEKHAFEDGDLIHEIVNHSKSEIVNDRGFSTNQVESKWSVMRRWVPKRNGGKLPGRKDRTGWKALLGESQWRKHAQYTRHIEVSELCKIPLILFATIAANMS